MKYSSFILAGIVIFSTVLAGSAQWRNMVPRRGNVQQTAVRTVENVQEKAAAVKQDVKAVAASVTKTAETKNKVKAAEETETEFPGTNDQWKDSQSVDWIAKEAESHKVPPHFNNRSVLRGDQHDGHAYGRYTEADLRLWESETVRLVMEGSRIFHDAELLGSTNGVSCDMCHPDGANTHPETYPKYQVQLGRAALLRDMMNWCLQNPCRAEPMSGDDPRMRAMEAYLNATSSGKPMKYGKH